jgi:hypothetical protein
MTYGCIAARVGDQVGEDRPAWCIEPSDSQHACRCCCSLAFLPCSVIEKDGCRVVCDPTSLDFLKGSKIEFEESLMRSAFVVSKHSRKEGPVTGSEMQPKFVDPLPALPRLCS